MKKSYTNKQTLVQRFSTHWNVLIWVLVLFSVYHTIRDILQILHIENIISVSLHTSKVLCNPICDYITFPPELFIIIAGGFLLKRNEFGILGRVVLVVFILWASEFWASYVFR